MRPLAPLLGWERWIALQELADTDHVVYRHPVVHDSAERRRLVDAAARLSRLRHPHQLEVEAYSFDERGRLCLVAPYTGNQEGLVTLDDLSARRSGHLEVPEVARCVEHLLRAMCEAYGLGLVGGMPDSTRVLIDRRGSIRYELFGLPPVPPIQERAASESDAVRAIAQMAVWLLTGLRQDVPPASMSRIAGRGARAWEPWIAAALDPVMGFDTLAEALDGLPNRTGAVPLPPPGDGRGPTPISTVLRRFRKAQGGQGSVSMDR